MLRHNEDNMLKEAADLLGITHLSDALGPVAWPVEGVLYGLYNRPIVCLPTSLSPDNTPCKNILYEVDLNAAITKLTPQAFQSLGPVGATRFAAHISINGQQPHQVHIGTHSDTHPDISVLGRDAMTRMGLDLNVYRKGPELRVQITKYYLQRF